MGYEQGQETKERTFLFGRAAAAAAAARSLGERRWFETNRVQPCTLEARFPPSYTADTHWYGYLFI